MSRKKALASLPCVLLQKVGRATAMGPSSLASSSGQQTMNFCAASSFYAAAVHTSTEEWQHVVHLLTGGSPTVTVITIKITSVGVSVKGNHGEAKLLRKKLAGSKSTSPRGI
ncbi:hypothetical protein OS493_031502, partial [Desmophyllum pertusum]